MIYLLNKNNMKKLAYIATIACSMFLTTSCVDLTQEPQSFITDEDYIASMDLTGLQQVQQDFITIYGMGTMVLTAVYNA